MTAATIVIPVFNRAHLVHRALDSALAQTIPCEVLLVDHGSSDDVGSVATRYGDRIRYIRRSTDSGPVACWQDGIAQATGDFVHITYDDDWIQATFMERCLEAFDDNVAFVYSRARLHSESRTTSELSVLHPPGRRPIEPLVQHLLRRPFALSPGCAVFRRDDALANLLDSVPDSHGRFGPGTGVGEDLLLFLLTTLRYSHYVHVGAPLADFLVHGGSITIGALRHGGSYQLEAAYETAKEFYLSQPEALARETGLRSFRSALRWLHDSRSTHLYLGKALKRVFRSAR